MARCEGVSSFPSALTVGQLKELFGESVLVHEVFTAGRYNDARNRHGVWVLDKGSFRMVLIKGGCPMLQNGTCTLGNRCPKPDLTE
jgi:hypothetical protein